MCRCAGPVAHGGKTKGGRKKCITKREEIKKRRNVERKGVRVTTRCSFSVEAPPAPPVGLYLPSFALFRLLIRELSLVCVSVSVCGGMCMGVAIILQSPTFAIYFLFIECVEATVMIDAFFFRKSKPKKNKQVMAVDVRYRIHEQGQRLCQVRYYSPSYYSRFRADASRMPSPILCLVSPFFYFYFLSFLFLIQYRF